MADKRLIWLGATVGSIIGAYIPALWGDSSMFSPMSFLLGAVGGVVGIVVGYRISRELS